MRVLIVNDYATATGGAELAALRLRELLRERGHDAALFASRARTGDGTFRGDFGCPGSTGSLRTVLQAANPGAPIALFRAIRSFRPDVVHVRMFLTQLSPLVLPLLDGVPSLLHVVTYRPICPVGTKRLPDGRACHSPPGRVCREEGCLPLRDWLPLMLQHGLWHRRRDAFDRIVANSEWVADRLRAEGFTVDGKLSYGVPDLGQRPALEPPPTVGFAGRLVPEKGADVLLRAMTRVVHRRPDARLLLAGAGPEEGRLRGLSRSLGLEEHVTFMGWVEREGLEEGLAPAWVQAVPSTWEEPFGLVAAEAMMRGTAVVASATGGLTEQVRDGQTGKTVPPGEPEPLAEGLGQILDDVEEAEAMGRAARDFARRRFTEERYVDDVVTLYEGILG